MNFESVLFWPAMLSCVILLVRSVPIMREGRGLGWALICGGILALGGAVLLLHWESGQWMVAALWAVLILLPSMLMRGAVQAVSRLHYERAAQLAAIVRWLHPADGWLHYPEIYRALALSQAGRREEAVASLEALAGTPHLPMVIVQTARVQTYRLQGQWEELAAWVEEATANGQPMRDLGARFSFVRALGETGRLREMVSTFAEISGSREGASALSQWAQCQLNLFAFTGRVAATDRLLAGPLATLPPSAKSFWQATARMAAGEVEKAREEFRALAANEGDQDLQRAIERRLTHGLANASDQLSAEDQAWLNQIETQTANDLAYHPQATAGLRGAYVTLTMIGLNCAMFAAELARGGSENIATLSRLGAMWPDAILILHQWYRLVTAMFLHAGWPHITMNLLALAVIGPWVEQSLGRWRYLILYIATGIGSMAAVLQFMRWGWIKPDMLVGASGAIMGLIGGTAALLAIGWRRKGSRLAARRLGFVILIVALQTVFDVITPFVSFSAHAAGVVLGVIFTLALARE